MTRPYWTHPVHIKYEIGRRMHRLFLKFVWLLPRHLVYWCAMRVGANATTGAYSSQIAADLTFMTALERWNLENSQKLAEGTE